MTHSFSRVPSTTVPRSSFDRSFGHKTTFDSGWLIPVYCDEAVPGDTFNLRMAAFARVATPIHPFMDNLYLDTHFFFVPMRLIWDNWQKFCGEQENPDDSTDFLTPHIDGSWEAESLGDYMGIPPGITVVHRSAHFRAYNLIWNEWFRDQNLQDSVDVPKGDGPDPIGTFELLRRGKRHDYFTSCLPWPQKGQAVELPLGTRAGVAVDNAPGEQIAVLNKDVSEIRGLDASSPAVDTAGPVLTAGDQLYADLSAATAATINQLRQAFQIQKMYERDARGGSRYTEIVRSHFGVVSPDARLQRPEFLGGGTTPINVNPVAQTSETQGPGTPQGNLAAYGTAHVSNHGFTKTFTEHGVLLGLVSARADLNYQQGINRMFLRRTKFDYFWPALSHIGEQAVTRKEIFATGDDGSDDTVFGYQERWAEYRYKPSQITGQFRSSFAQPLDSWHLAQNFETAPVLDAEFIVENPPVDRVIAVQDEPHFLLDTHVKLRCARPMPLFSTPGLIDHF